MPLKRAVLEKTAQNFTSTGGSELNKKDAVVDVSQKKPEISQKSLAFSDTEPKEEIKGIISAYNALTSPYQDVPRFSC